MTHKHRICVQKSSFVIKQPYFLYIQQNLGRIINGTSASEPVCRFRRWQALHIFGVKFQGCYKDGVNGTKDFRSLAGLYLVVQINNNWGYWRPQFLCNGVAVKYSHIYCCILAHCHCKTLQEKLHERSGESHDRFAWITVTILIFAYQYVLPTKEHLLLLYLIITLTSIPQLVLILYVLYHPLRGRRLVKYITVKITNLKPMQEVRILNSRSLIHSQIEWLTLISTGHYYLLKVNLHINKTVRNRVIMNNA